MLFTKKDFNIKNFSLFPSSERDWTITLSQKVPIKNILQEIKTLSPPLLENIHLIDLYIDKKLGLDKKNVTFRFTYRDKNKTLTFEEVEKIHDTLITKTIKNLKNYIFS